MSTNFNPNLSLTSTNFEPDMETPAHATQATHAEEATTSEGSAPKGGRPPEERLTGSLAEMLKSQFSALDESNQPLPALPSHNQPIQGDGAITSRSNPTESGETPGGAAKAAQSSVGGRALGRLFKSGQSSRQPAVGGSKSKLPLLSFKGFFGRGSSKTSNEEASGSQIPSLPPAGQFKLGVSYGKDTVSGYMNAVHTTYPSIHADQVNLMAEMEFKKAQKAEQGNQALGHKLMEGTLTLQDSHKLDLSSYGANEKDDPLTKAAKWINNASNSARSSNTEVSETRAMLEELQNKGTQFDSLDGLREINSRVLGRASGEPAGPAPDRLHGLDAPYPSYVGVGSKVLADGLSMAEVAKAGQVPASQRGAYVLGTTLRSHGFEDGNGRTARIAYALSQLQEDPSKFDAITKEYEDELSGLGERAR